MLPVCRYLIGIFLGLGILVTGTLNLTAQTQQEKDKNESEEPVEDPIVTILRQRVDAYRQTVGIVVGEIRGTRRTVYARGTLNRATIRKATGMKVFEIGPLSSLYTSALLGLMVKDGEVSLSDPVSKFLPDSVKIPEYSGQPIRLEHLATHTSGLPRLPNNVISADLNNPLDGYSVDLLYQFLSTYPLTYDVGTTYEYSEVGMGLLGHVLAWQAGKSYDALIQEYISTPLKLANTGSTPTISMKTLMATGHDRTRRPITAWSDTTLVGGNGVRSNILDMMAFISANMGIIYVMPEYTEEDSIKFQAAFEEVIRPRYAASRPGVETALGWRARKGARDRYTHWLSGRTGGFYSFVGFNKLSRRGVIVLSNSSVSIDDIGFHILTPGYPLASPPKLTSTADPQTFQAYTGTYEFSPGLTVDIMTTDGKLYGQPPGQMRSELFPESNRNFFLQQENAQITFVKDAAGNITHLLFLKNGQTREARKIR